MVDKFGPINTFFTPASQLSTEDTWKKFIYPHYGLNESTPVLAVRAELVQYPTFISGISRLASYMSYITEDTAPPLIPPPPPPQPPQGGNPITVPVLVVTTPHQP